MSDVRLSAKSEVSRQWIKYAAIVAAFIFIGYFVIAISSTSETTFVKPSAKIATETTDPGIYFMAHPKESIKRMIRVSGGNYNKLSTQDQGLLSSATAGHGQTFFEAEVKKVKNNTLSKGAATP